VLIGGLKNFLLEHGIVSKETFRQTVKEGTGVWWKVVGDRLYLKGLENVCRRLGVDRLRKSPAIVPLEAFRQIGELRAHLYATFFNRNDRPMSRETIKEITGVSARSQRYYERRAKVQIVQNWSRTRLPHRFSENALGRGQYQRYEKGSWCLYKRLPDTRTSNYQRAGRGMLRRLNRRLRGGVDGIVGECRKGKRWFSQGGKPSRFRRYFHDARALLKAKNPLDVVFLRVAGHSDRLLWEPVYLG